MPETSLPRLAYLSSWYPAVSVTFILREAEALREIGADVLPASIRRSPPEQHLGPAERAEAARTFNVIAAVRAPATLAAALLFAARRPGRILRAAGLAWRTRRAGLRGHLWQGAYLLEALVLAHWLVRERREHLHVHFVGGVATVGLLAAEIAGIPWSLTVHGPSDFEEPHRWHLGEKVARAAFVACISHFARSQVMRLADPAHWDRLRIVHCGVAPERYGHPEGAGDSSDARDQNVVELLFVGRLAPVKGLRVLIAALARVEARVRLTIVGDGPDRAALEAAAAPLGDPIRFTGYLSQDEVAAALSRAQVVVLPSFAEGVPVMLMEAMAARLPVIATAVAGTGELVADGICGLLVPPGDEGALATAIDQLAANPGLRRRMGAAGRARVAAEFDMRLEARRLAGLFAGRSGGAPRPEPLPPRETQAAGEPMSAGRS